MSDAADQNPERKRRARRAAAPDGIEPVADACGSDRGPVADACGSVPELDVHRQVTAAKMACDETRIVEEATK